MHRAAIWRRLAVAAALAGGWGGTQAAEVILTMNAYGPIQVGMTARELQHQLHVMGRASLAPPTALPAKGCVDYAASDALRFRLENGRVVRIETTEKDVVTPSGLRIGSSLARVRHQLGSRIEEDTRQDGNGHEHSRIVLVSGDQRHAIRVEAQGTVTRLYTGSAAAIRAPERCAK